MIRKLWEYHAIDAEKQIHRGSVFAGSRGEAVYILAQKGYRVTQLRELTGADAGLIIKLRKLKALQKKLQTPPDEFSERSN